MATYLGEVRFWQTSADAAQAFLEGYEAVRPLQRWKRAALPALEAARHLQALGTPALNVNEWGSAYLSDRLIDGLLEAIHHTATGLG